jgi:hypothetical protein
MQARRASAVSFRTVLTVTDLTAVDDNEGQQVDTTKVQTLMVYNTLLHESISILAWLSG